eukprot:1927342-Rhodomonas_salina.2
MMPSLFKGSPLTVDCSPFTPDPQTTVFTPSPRDFPSHSSSPHTPRNVPSQWACPQRCRCCGWDSHTLCQYWTSRSTRVGPAPAFAMSVPDIA